MRWHRDVTADQWKAFAAAFLGWMLDGFDYTILLLLLGDIQQTFSVNNALLGALGTVTQIFRVGGGIAAGTAADRWGRKGPLMFSILCNHKFAILIKSSLLGRRAPKIFFRRRVITCEC